MELLLSALISNGPPRFQLWSTHGKTLSTSFSLVSPIYVPLLIRHQGVPHAMSFASPSSGGSHKILPSLLIQ
eukprot:6406861-Prorocentrum_lima.AAC.1